MIEAIAVTVAPVGFLIVLFGGGAAFKRRAIEQDGEAPIDRTLFYISKYSILVVWGAMVLQSWGIGLSVIEAPAVVAGIALALWVFGFAFLFLGRFELGSSFRLGAPRESTSLKVGGLFRFSRNPMYLGMYATIVASVLYTLNPLVLVLGACVVAIHHRIVLAEEDGMRTVFGQEVRGLFPSRQAVHLADAGRGLDPLLTPPTARAAIRRARHRPERVRRDRAALPPPSRPPAPRLEVLTRSCGPEPVGICATGPARPEPATSDR